MTDFHDRYAIKVAARSIVEELLNPEYDLYVRLQKISEIQDIKVAQAVIQELCSKFE